MNRTTAPQPNAAIFSRGYRPYEGERGGLATAIASVSRQSIRSVLGIGRPARFKIAPVAISMISYFNAITYAGLAAIGGAELLDAIGFSYADTVSNNFLYLALFTVVVVPTALVNDRRNGLFGMYLTTPLTKLSYVSSKALAVVVTLLLVTLGPGVVVLLGLTFSDAGPDGFVAWITVAGRILAGGLALSLLYGLFAMAGSCLTTRTLIAIIGVAVVFILGASLAGVLDAAGYDPVWGCISIPIEGYRLTQAIFGEPISGGVSARDVWLAALGHLALSCGVLTWRYSTLQETR